MQSLRTPSLVDQLLAMPDAGAWRSYLAENAASFSDQDLQALKSIADHCLRSDLDRYLAIGEMLQGIADTAQNESARALSLLIQGNACAVGGIGEYARAVELYDQAAAIYATLNRPLEEARSQVGKVFALTHLGRHQEAESTARWAAEVLEAYEEWLPLAKMVSNLGISYSRQGDDLQSLAMFDRAREVCLNLETEPNPFLPNVEHNRSIALRDLGRYDEAIDASERARELHMGMENTVEAARALQSLATTYFVLANYNEALSLLDQVRREFSDDGRVRDAMRAELLMANCLVQLRRFHAVLEKCDQVRARFGASGAQYEVAQALLYSAIAYTGLGLHEGAWESLEAAGALFEKEGNPVGGASIRLRQSHLLYLQERYQQSADLAAECTGLFTVLDRIVDAAFARVAHARSLVALGQDGTASALLEMACALGEQKNLPDLCQQCHHLLGIVAAQDGDAVHALAEFDAAIDALEILRGRLMVEFRAGFLEDRESVYAHAVQVCVDNGNPEQALAYVEQAKSRALIDLLGQQVNLRVRARSSADKPLLDELMMLRSERERLANRWAVNEGNRSAALSSGDTSLLDAQSAVLDVEKRITELWHVLLIRNADYAQDAALWRTRLEPFQDLIPEDCVLLEYYIAQNRLMLFTVSRQDVSVNPLNVSPDEIHRLLELVHLNMMAAASLRNQRQCTDLTIRAQKILSRLYDRLIAPIASTLSDFRQLIIVPHAALHYLPFQALFDGERYLLEDFEIGYLPSGSFMHYCTRKRAQRGSMLAMGHSNGGLLPNAPAEAADVADLMGGTAFVENGATKTELSRAAQEAAILHFAVHGEFRADNPLFSGLLLDDGWLATLDIFDLDLRASLVTLSACQTGRNVIGGGDELLGLMRAFLSAGVESLVLTHWRVEDSSTARLMRDFYMRLARGDTKRAALREAQLSLLKHEGLSSGRGLDGCTSAHPYYWAPFFLVGNSDSLLPR